MAKKRPAKKRTPKKQVQSRGSRVQGKAAKKTPATKRTTKKRTAKKRTATKQTKQPAPAATLNPQPSTLNPPAWLPADAAAHWPLVIDQLRERDKLEMATPQHIAIYCRTLARYLKAMDAVEEKGFTVATERGKFVSPETQIALKLIDHLRHLAKDLGLNEPVVGYQAAMQELTQRLQAKQAAGLN